MPVVLLLNGVPQKGRISLIQREANGNYTIESVTLAPLEDVKSESKNATTPNTLESK